MKTKYTIKELKNMAVKKYPSALKEVKKNKYKVTGFSGYLLLDNINKDGTVAQLFYRNKWRQDDINIIEGNQLFGLATEDNKASGIGRYATVEEAIKDYNESYRYNNSKLAKHRYVVDYETRELICTIDEFIDYTILKKNPEYPTCNIEYETQSIEELNKYPFKIECYFVNNNKRTDNVFCVGDTYQECIDRYFKKKESWSYCNGTYIDFCNPKDNENFKEKFYGEKEGLSNYIRMGGNMD